MKKNLFQKAKLKAKYNLHKLSSHEVQDLAIQLNILLLTSNGTYILSKQESDILKLAHELE